MLTQCSTLLLLQKLNWLSVKERIQYCTAVLVYKCLNKMAPANLSDLFQFCGENHSYTLRNTGNDLLVPKPNTVILRRSFRYTGSITWNKLPSYIKESVNINFFKRNLKNYLVEKRQSSHVF